MAINIHKNEQMTLDAHTATFFNVLGGPLLSLYHEVSSKGGEVTVDSQKVTVKDSNGVQINWVSIPVLSSAVVKGMMPPSMKPKVVTVLTALLQSSLKTLKGEVVSDPMTAEKFSKPVFFEDLSEEKPQPKTISFTGSGEIKLPTGPSVPVQAAAAMNPGQVTDKAKAVEMLKQWNAFFPKHVLASVLEEAFPGEVKTVSGSMSMGQAHQTIPKPTANVDLNTVVHLKDATHLKQAVHGTSAGSIYRVVGLGPRIRMAVRVKGGQLSVRVEGPLNPQEKNSLVLLGFKGGGAYMSNHYTLGSCPPERVLGAIFMTEGLEFTQTVSKLSEVPSGH